MVIIIMIIIKSFYQIISHHIFYFIQKNPFISIINIIIIIVY